MDMFYGILNTFSLQTSKKPSLRADMSEIQAPIHIYSQAEPKFYQGAVFTTPAINCKVYSKNIDEYRARLLARVM